MTDLKLVAPDQPTAFERQLLDAAINEAPSAEHRMRVRLALGLPAVATAPPSVVKAGRRALAVKGAAVSLVVASAALLWFSGVGRTPQLSPVLGNPSITIPTAAFPAVQPAATPEPAAQPMPPIQPASESEGNGLLPRAKRGARTASLPSSAVSAESAESGADLNEQLRLIDAARSAVAAGDAKSASAAIASYTSRFPRGAFGQEAAVLRIETLDLQGNHTQAASLARSFLARHPNSPHVNVVQHIAGRAQ
ncbi:MAG: outer membrane protein assembly factor BamD [Polyangiaceae bacterium]